MFGRKKDDNKIDVASVNELIRTSKNVVNILFILLIGCLIFLVGHLLINWGILASIKTLIKSTTIIGFIIAWLLDPLVDFLQTKGWKRSIATFFIFFAFLLILVFFFYLIIPTLGKQIQDAKKTLIKEIEG